jgi:hypothetical protein
MFLSAIVAPWWLAAIGAFLLALRFRAWEVIVLGVLLDVMWLPFEIAHGVPIATGSALLLVWAFEPLRRQFLFDYE